MLFNSYIFVLLFLPLTLLLYLFVKRNIGLESSFIVLCVASLIYYAYWKAAYLPILLLSIIGNYSLGTLLSSNIAPKSKKIILFLGVFGNLAALGYYKYADFFIANINSLLDAKFNLPDIVLPLAISFFTFQQIAYLVDAYRGEVREYKFIHYFLFVTFFPQLIAGPIVHHKEMLPQFMAKARQLIGLKLLWLGIAQFSIGLFKKVVIADTLAGYATPIFSAADQGFGITMAEAWIGVFAYTFQLYFNFSGYTDMALGIGKMFGIHLPMNFNSPYKSSSISDFWRRWHMTLSRFLRDYVYIPLGGNRKGPRRQQINLFCTMALGGLWHGANWNFVLWGALHGVYLIINHSWTSFCRQMAWHVERSKIYYVFAVGLTFICVISGWVLFRAETFSGAMQIFSAAIGLTEQFSEIGRIDRSPIVADFLTSSVFVGSCALVAFFCPNVHQILPWLEEKMYPDTEQFSKVPVNFIVQAVLSAILIISIASMNRVSEFLYFQF